MLTKEKVTEIALETFDEYVGKKIKPEQNLYLDLGLDSLDYVELVLNLEERLAASLRTMDLNANKAKTVQDVLNFIYIDMGFEKQQEKPITISKKQFLPFFNIQKGKENDRTRNS